MVVLFPTGDLKSTTGHEPKQIMNHYNRVYEEYTPAKSYKIPTSARVRYALTKARRFFGLKRGGRVKRRRQRKVHRKRC